MYIAVYIQKNGWLFDYTVETEHDDKCALKHNIVYETETTC